MKSNAATFLLGALVGGALALGARAAILSLNDGGHAGHAGHGDHAAMEEPAEPAATPAPTGFLIDLGNELCPIMKKPVTGKTWSEWNGLRVGHCCPPCIKKFLADPEKALDEAGVEWREAARLVDAVKAANGEERKRLLAEADAKYGIVRMPEGGK
jgi:hypothetical protein